MSLFDSGAKSTFIGVIFIVIAIVFLLSGLDIIRLGIMKAGQQIISREADILIAFVLMVVGLGYIYSEVGKPKYEVTLGEQKMNPK
jgi:uncharacterized membrane protein YozB (DUF420 family)